MTSKLNRKQIVAKIIEKKYFFDIILSLEFIFGWFCPCNYIGISNKSAGWSTPFWRLFKNASIFFEIVLGKYSFIHFGSTEPCG